MLEHPFPSAHARSDPEDLSSLLQGTLRTVRESCNLASKEAKPNCHPPHTHLCCLHCPQLLQPPPELRQRPLAPHPPRGGQGSLEELRGVSFGGDDQRVSGGSFLIFGFIVVLQHFPTAGKKKDYFSPGACNISWIL